MKSIDEHIQKDQSEIEVAKAAGDEAKVLFFFKQKTAYEIMPSLVGSEMCIRDRSRSG